MPTDWPRERAAPTPAVPQPPVNDFSDLDDDPPVYERSRSYAKHSKSRAGLWIGLGLGSVALFGLAAGAAFLIAKSPAFDRSKSTGPKPVSLSKEEKAAASEAIKGLGRLEAATEVGVTYLKYRELLIEVKAAINEADRILPPCDLRTALMDSMRAYELAGSAWKDKIDVHEDEGGKYGRQMQVAWKLAGEMLVKARSLQDR